jgi:glucose-6-phosphate dehydrogenase assembly protein OpcA
MQKSSESNSDQLQPGAMLDVQSIERQLNELWMQNAGTGGSSDDGAMLRARVLNLMVFVTSEDALNDVDAMLMDVAAQHPCRAVLMLGDASGEDQDIDMRVSSRCLIGGRSSGRHLCCEQVTLRAAGRFTIELPSASVPLLVADLPVFLWWRAALVFADERFQRLLRASDRLIIDSAGYKNPAEELRELANFLRRRRKNDPAVSDLNWGRLTAWRGLLASLYDTAIHRDALDRLSRIRVEYVSPASDATAIAPKALVLAGWLASRLGWTVANSASQIRSAANQRVTMLEKAGSTLRLEFVAVEHSAVAPGGIARVDLIAESDPAMGFVITREEAGRNLETLEGLGEQAHVTRVVTGGDKSEAALLVGELEILGHDSTYEEAVERAIEILDSL